MIPLSYILLPRLSSFDSADRLRDIFALLRDFGYAGVELNITEPLGIDRKALRAMTADAGLAVPSFLTGEAYSEGLCLSSPDDAVRRATVERLVGYVDVAAEFDAILVVGLLQGLRRDEPDPVVAQKRIVEGLKTVAEKSAARNVTVVIEPVNHLQVGFNNSVAEVLGLIEAIGSPAVQPMVDTIHLNIEERSLTEPILACGKALRHVHLCESNGGRFGTGHIDFAAVQQALARVGYAHYASVKVYRQVGLEEAARSSLGHLRAHGFG